MFNLKRLVAMLLLVATTSLTLFISNPKSFVWADEADEDVEVQSVDISYDAEHHVDGQFVERLYVHCLGREGTFEECNFWVEGLEGTLTGTSVAYRFIFSNEFVNRNLSNEEYLQTLYKVFMNREPDATGNSFWLNKLAQGATREQVFEGFCNAPEFNTTCAQANIVAGSYICGGDIGKLDFIAHYIHAFYTYALKRNASAPEMKYWVNGLYSGEVTASSFVYSVLLSDEHRNTNANMKAAELLKLIYPLILGRTASKDEINGYANCYLNGGTDLDAINIILSSPEFGARATSIGIVTGTFLSNSNAVNVMARANAKVIYFSLQLVEIDTTSDISTVHIVINGGADFQTFISAYGRTAWSYYRLSDFRTDGNGNLYFDRTRRLDCESSGADRIQPGEAYFDISVEGFIIYETNFVVT